MFANFFGIVIISVSALLITSLVLRSDPNLPATMNLGLVDSTDSTQQATSTDAANSASNDDASAGAVAADNSASSGDDSASDTTNSSGAVDSTTQAVVESGTDSKPAAAASTKGFSKAYLESKRRALEEVGSAPTRTNKSDADKYNK